MDKITLIDPPWRVLLTPTKENVGEWLKHLLSLELDENVRQAIRQANEILAGLV